MLIAEVINGTYAGETMGGDAYFAGAGSDKEMVFGMNFPAYMALIFDMMGEESGFDPSVLSESEAWMYYTVDFTEQGVACTSTVDGSDIAEMIGIMATSANPVPSAPPVILREKGGAARGGPSSHPSGGRAGGSLRAPPG